MKEFSVEKPGGADEILTLLAKAESIGKKNLINLPASFDTENSSFYDNEGEKCAICYIWMFGVDNEIIYGRNLEDFRISIGFVNQMLTVVNKRLIVYVHNLKYDYQFIKHFIKFDKVFAKSARNILFATYGNVEFRDSLALAGGKSLEKIGKSLRNQTLKKVGDLDYSLIRTPITPLTKKELGYCEYDIRVLNEYIREKIEDDGSIENIPYTNTGYVRRYVRDQCLKNSKQYIAFMDNLTMTAACYLQMERTFMGGAVGPNFSMAGKVIENVASYDIKSSYPYAMSAFKYPMHYPISIPNKDAYKTLMDIITHVDNPDYVCSFKLEVFALAPKSNSHCYPISISKCVDSVGAVEIHGRVVTAQYISIFCTELDFITFSRFYDLSVCNTRISSMRVFKAEYLPKPILRSVLSFFNKKTVLDGKVGAELEYTISKNMLNAIYGMMVEKPVRPGYSVADGNILKKIDPDYAASVGEYNDKWNRVLYYPWGVWVTAYARYRLYDAIYTCGEDFLYCDTDSVKVSHAEKYKWYFDKENAIAHKKMRAVAQRMDLPIDYVIPTSPADNREKCLGVWEYEYNCELFKTLGPKRYMLLKDNGKYLLTVAGTNKQSTLEYILTRAEAENVSPFAIFDNNLVVPPEYSRRLIATFIDSPRSGYVTDYLGEKYFYQVPSGVHMEPAPYSFNVEENEIEAAKVVLGMAFNETEEL